MIKPSRRTRDIGDAVVRRTTMLVAAGCLVGTGAFAAIQARTYAASHPAGVTKITAPEGVTNRASAGSHDSHDSGDSHDSDDHDGTSSQPTAAPTKTFSQPAAAPTNAGGSTARVVSGGS